MFVSDIPKVRNFEVTNLCNLNCPVCVEKNSKTGNLDLELLNKILSKNKEVFDNSTIWLHFRGEPFMNKDLFHIIESMHNSNVKTRLSTNGILLNDENINKTINSKLNFMVISAMTIDENEYTKLRGKSFLPKVLNNIENIQNRAKKHNSDIKLQVMGLDYGQGSKKIEEFIKYFHSMGLEVAIHKYSDRTGLSRYNPNMLTNYAMENRVPCQWIYNDIIILHDGSLTTCFFDLGAQNIIGSLADFDYSINELWNSKRFTELREKQQKNIYENACENCTDWAYYNPDFSGEVNSFVRIYPLDGEPYDV